MLLGVVIAALIGTALQPVYGALSDRVGRRPNVRYTGFAGSRELGAALVGFSPTLSAALLGWGVGDPWLVAACMIFACLVSLIAFLASEETKDLEMGAEDPGQEAIVTATKVAEEESLTPVGS